MKIIYPKEEPKKAPLYRLPKKYTKETRETVVNQGAELLREFYEQHRKDYSPYEISGFLHSSITKLADQEMKKK
jgi:hypothetical protein